MWNHLLVLIPPSSFLSVWTVWIYKKEYAGVPHFYFHKINCCFLCSECQCEVVGIWYCGPPPVRLWPWVNCPELTHQHFVSLYTVEQPTDPHPPNLSVISDWPSLWQVSGLKLNTCDKFYKDEILAKGLFRQLRHFIPQLPPGAFQGSWGSHCFLHFKNEKKNVSLHSITGKGVPHPLT